MSAAFDLDEPYVSTDPGDRDVHVLGDAQPGNPMPFGWPSLTMGQGPGSRDPRGMARMLFRLGLNPHAVHGLTPDGACTCGRRDCAAVGKHPVLRAWQHADVDPDELDAMLASNWRLNLGIRTGPQPCRQFLVAVDVDGPLSLLEPLEREHGPFPATLTARTGRGGYHLYYWSRVEMGNRAKVVPGVDVRGAGGHVVCAPSRHTSGNYYEWINAREPAVLP